MTPPRILVIEDEARLRAIIQIQLASAGFDVSIAEDWPTARILISRVVPELIVTNIQLPGPDGFEICRRVRADRELSHVPVVFLTFRSDADSRARALAAGANDYITKPWTVSDLVSRISALIKRAPRPESL